MEREKLIISAQKIKLPGADALEQYRNNRDKASHKLNTRMESRPDIYELIGGENNISMMRDNHANHTRFIYSIMVEFDPSTLVDTIVWVFRAYRSRKFHPNYWAAQLNGWIEILSEMLPAESYSQIVPIYEWMQIHIPDFTELSDDNSVMCQTGIVH
ncbi:MAG: hypothetical protein A2015_06255 [Spirochaetes bacterium GWF1_31_7]|nr:MAG: hypothetical protein A2Y30_08080 [Spirochaetes bacterium GWE1_32_154]OHD51350.1 MAG: hypothetical protein A2Y29_14470 [Spirochaetes bacterium GWE2_31_10]OHD53076.1 MAG: hypothetical protein A2015_06255 [Spirochaetes bacterium GWF1_31_7]OHD74444.1 MAG: hypothetical protein A2355_15625 [Spirochaetes bacterium RIFOXYB1_FULL_32_8]HBD95147.1 hypothetical protein [Spirochaetia bacterium]